MFSKKSNLCTSATGCSFIVCTIATSLYTFSPFTFCVTFFVIIVWISIWFFKSFYFLHFKFIIIPLLHWKKKIKNYKEIYIGSITSIHIYNLHTAEKKKIVIMMEYIFIFFNYKLWFICKLIFNTYRYFIIRTILSSLIIFRHYSGCSETVFTIFIIRNCILTVSGI